jgi:3-hydroxymyristoyl/3-hydroxydecanoyl-(acyl carrier protein) dehydratase
MTDRFSTFSFVDQITEVEPGAGGQGRFVVPAGLRGFPPCLVAEAVGQLAAWVAMAQVGFRRRPVAGLAGEVRILGNVAPGQILDLEVEIESCDLDVVAYGGRACAGNTKIVTLSHCVGSMLPVEEFDAPEELRGHFAVLCGPGASPGRFQGIPAPQLALTERDPGRTLHALMQVPASASFFTDHFPRRPVFPGALLLDAQMRLAVTLAGEALHPGPRAHLRPHRVKDVKLRSFILPGQAVELRAETISIARKTAVVAVAARVGGKLVSTGQVEIIPRGTA